MHFCQDELYAMLMALPFLGYFGAWVKTKFHKPHPGHHEVKSLRTYGGPPDSTKQRAWPWRG